MSATLGNRRFPELPGCVNCGEPVQTTNYALGPKVEHYDPDASFRDSVWWHCRLSVATLPVTGGSTPNPTGATCSNAPSEGSS